MSILCCSHLSVSLSSWGAEPSSWMADWMTCSDYQWGVWWIIFWIIWGRLSRCHCHCACLQAISFKPPESFSCTSNILTTYIQGKRRHSRLHIQPCVNDSTDHFFVFVYLKSAYLLPFSETFCVSSSLSLLSVCNDSHEISCNIMEAISITFFIRCSWPFINTQWGTSLEGHYHSCSAVELQRCLTAGSGLLLFVMPPRLPRQSARKTG